MTTRAAPGHPARHNLPVPITSFIGRQSEMADVQARLQDVRLFTLTGVGGCGKTRLALEVARAVQDRFRDGVWVVELGPLADPALVPHSVAAVVGIREAAGQTALGALVARLRTRSLLLVLDNCEHLLDACAQLVDALLRACPDVHVLTTSREALRVTGEITLRVPSLRVPDPQQLPALAELRDYPAVRLFVERALAVELSFQLTKDNAPEVAQVCARLDGIPLALELAAARLASLSVKQLAARLDQRFRLLTGGSRAALPRQQTLKATLDWSYELLDEPERRLFRQLAVFAGGWSLAAVEQVCAQEGIEQASALDLLARLVSKSLVMAEDTTEGAKRYRLLETVRQYARDWLVATGEVEAARCRHTTWFLTYAESLHPNELVWRNLVAGGAVLDQLEREMDNLRSALRFWIESEDADSAVRQAAALFPIWFFRGSIAEGRAWLEELLSLPGARAMRHVRERGLTLLGNLARRHGEYPVALDAFQELLSLQRADGSTTDVATTLWHLANVHFLRADYSEAWASLAESQACGGDVAEPSLGTTWRYIGSCIALHQGRFELARTLLNEALDQPNEPSGSLFSGYCLLNLGLVEREQGNRAEASSLLERCLALASDYGDRTLLAHFLEGISGLESAVGRHTRALRLGGAAAALRETIGAPLPPSWQSLSERWLTLSRGALSDAAAAAAWNIGREMPLDEAIGHAREPFEAMASGASTSAGPASMSAQERLTPREREVAALVAEGLTNGQIAERLLITQRTVAAHMEHILNKLGFASRTQVGVWAAEHDLIAPSPA